MTTPAGSWLVATSAWWGPGRRVGRCAVRLDDGIGGGFGEGVGGGFGEGVGGGYGGRGPVPVADVPPGASVVELPGTLLPGLRDAHVHAALVDLSAVRDGGIAGCDDLGGVPAEVGRLLALSRRPDSALPRLDVAGAFLIAAGGYPSDRPWAPPGSWRTVPGTEDAAAAVGEQVAVGATAVKLVIHPDAGPVLPAAVLAALADAAHAAGVEVVVHAEGAGSTRRALEIGADRLAHAPWTEVLDPGIVRECAGRTTWISTLDIHGWGAPSAAAGTAVDNVRRFVEAGGRIRYGTDLGNGPLVPGVNPREVRALQAAGLSPDDVLVSMTDPAGAAGTPPAGTSPLPPCWVPGGLDLSPAGFAASLATARVLTRSTVSDVSVWSHSRHQPFTSG